MNVLKWAALGAAAAALAGLKLYALGAFATDGAQVENTRYLVARYKAAPSETTSLIRRHTSVCLAEKIGKETSVDLESFFGELMVYMVRRVERDSSAFVSGYRALAERDGPAIDARIAFLPEPEKQRLAALVDDLADGPHAMVGCVATKMKLTHMGRYVSGYLTGFAPSSSSNSPILTVSPLRRVRSTLAGG